eukprot:Hpha_TRINITY_DN14949_c3_g19::TRINITY_DN14949_c3_g19_i1::g.144265::m.144265
MAKGLPLAVVSGFISSTSFLCICLSLFFVGRHYSHRSVDDLEEMIRVLLPQSVDTTLLHKLALVPRFMNMTSNFIDGRRLDLQTWEGEVMLRDVMTAYLQTFPGESKCCSGFLTVPKGATVTTQGPNNDFEFWNVVLLRPKNIDWWYKDGVNSSEVEMTTWNPINQSEVLVTKVPAVALSGAIVPWFSPDPTVLRPTYTPAVVWTIDKPELKLHAVKPLYKLGSVPSRQNWIGTYVAGFKLGFLSRFLEDSVKGTNARMVMVMIDATPVNEGVLLASSIRKVPVISCYDQDRCDAGEFEPCTPCGPDDVMTPTKAVASPNRLVGDISRRVLEKGGGAWPNLLTRHLNTDVSAGDETQLVSTWSVTKYHLQWVCILAVPRKEIFGTLDEGEKIMTILAVVFCVVGVFLFIVMSIVISRPLHSLAFRMFAVSEMDLDGEDSPSCAGNGFIKEFTVAETSFRFMVAQLKEFKTFIPANVFADEEEDIPSESDKGLDKKATSGSFRKTPSGSFRKGSFNKIPSWTGSLDSLTSHKATTPKARGAPKALGNLCETPRAVTVLATKVGVDLPAVGTDLCTHIKEYVTIVCDVAGTFTGAPEFADGYNMVITWGTSKAQSAQEMKACSAAAQIADRSSSSVVIGISRGTAVAGAIGCDRMRKILGVGPMYSDAMRFRDLNEMYQTTTIVSEKVHAETYLNMKLLPIDVIPGKKLGTQVRLYHLLGSRGANENGEWMYELENSERKRCDESDHWNTFLTTPPPYTALLDDIAQLKDPSMARLRVLLNSSVDGRVHATVLQLGSYRGSHVGGTLELAEGAEAHVPADRASCDGPKGAEESEEVVVQVQ